MDIKTAKLLHAGDEIYHKNAKNCDGTAQRFKVTSVRTWKRSPERVEVRLKRGLREFGTITSNKLCFFTDKEPDKDE